MRRGGLLAVLIILNLRMGVAQVLMEVPLLLELPRSEQLLRAWYDGEIFLVDGGELFQALGFTVQQNEVQFKAWDTRHRYTFTCASPVQDFSCRISMNDVLDRLGSSLYFDQTRLHLRASSVATTFDIHALYQQQSGWTNGSGPHLFGRTRKFWGGMMASWQLRQDALRDRGLHIQPTIKLTGSVLFGSVEIDLGRGSAWRYRFDMPQGQWLSQVEASQGTDGFYGLLITNTPLASPRLQRTQAIRGESEPHALVQAVIGGEVLDQVQADTDGNYELNAPAWYGSTKLEVRTQPLGEYRVTSRVRYLFVPSSLLPSGAVYYHFRAHEREQSVNLQIGVHQRLTLQTSLSHVPERADFKVGFTLNPLTFLMLGSEVQFSNRRWMSTLQLWRPGLQVTAHIDVLPQESLNTSITSSIGHGPISALFRGSQMIYLDQYQHLSIHPEIWFHSSEGFLMRGSWEFERLHGPSIENRSYHRWLISLGWSFPHLRLLAFAEHRHLQQLYGMEGLIPRRNRSIGFRVGWDADLGSIVGSLRFQVSSSWGSLFAWAQRDVHNLSHSQQAQGSVHFGREIKLAPYSHQESSVELRIFEDLNGNGIQDAVEQILPHIEAQLHQRGWTRLKTGALYAAYLEPYQRYQVRILDASIRDPLLHPATGLEFSFTTDPGRRKIIHVPMQERVQVTGQITGLDRAPLRLRVLLNQGESETEVYRDGGFTFHVRTGHYTLTVIDQLSKELLANQTIEVGTIPIRVTIDLKRDTQ